jgi:hypothetical protein
MKSKADAEWDEFVDRLFEDLGEECVTTAALLTMEIEARHSRQPATGPKDIVRWRREIKSGKNRIEIGSEWVGCWLAQLSLPQLKIFRQMAEALILETAH